LNKHNVACFEYVQLPEIDISRRVAGWLSRATNRGSMSPSD
jgi:hypothetical protein